MTSSNRKVATKKRRSHALGDVLTAPLLAMLLAACNTAETFNLGYVQDEQTIALVEEGSSRDQVLLALGTPSQITSDSGDGGDTFYYISQTKTRGLAYQRSRVVGQRVLAIYFNEDAEVTRKANYGLQDGKVFDFISRTTPTGGADLNFIGQVLGSFGKIAAR
ncbi:MAG: outer membrane protein assembly factor BamE [Pseudomonadota bacterium]